MYILRHKSCIKKWNWYAQTYSTLERLKTLYSVAVCVCLCAYAKKVLAGMNSSVCKIADNRNATCWCAVLGTLDQFCRYLPSCRAPFDVAEGYTCPWTKAITTALANRCSQTDLEQTLRGGVAYRHLPPSDSGTDGWHPPPTHPPCLTSPRPTVPHPTPWCGGGGVRRGCTASRPTCTIYYVRVHSKTR